VSEASKASKLLVYLNRCW